MEISVLILSCVILGLNPVLPVLLYFIFLISRFVTLYGFYQIKYIHTYTPGSQPGHLSSPKTDTVKALTYTTHKGLVYTKYTK